MPRKSTESHAAQAKAEDDGVTTSKPAKSDQKGLSVEELNLPRSMVQRLAKGMLPLNTSIQKDALLALSRSATVFVSYLASNANDRAVLNNKKTVQPVDVFAALNELEFPVFIPRVQQELDLYNKEQCEKRNTYRKRVRQEQTMSDPVKSKEDGDNAGQEETEGGAIANGSARDSSTHVNGTRRMDDEPPASKKARMSSGAVHPDDDNALNDDNDEDDNTIDDNAGDNDDPMEDDEAEDDEDEEIEDGEDGEQGEQGEEGEDAEDGLADPERVPLDDDDDDEGNDSQSD